MSEYCSIIRAGPLPPDHDGDPPGVSSVGG